MPPPPDRRLLGQRQPTPASLCRRAGWLAGRELDDAAPAAYLAELHAAGRASSSASMAVAAACVRAKLAEQPTPAGERDGPGRPWNNCRPAPGPSRAVRRMSSATGSAKKRNGRGRTRTWCAGSSMNAVARERSCRPTPTIERLCADALVDAERRIEARIAERVPPGLRRELKHLLDETVDAGVTRFVWLRQFEPGSNFRRRQPAAGPPRAPAATTTCPPAAAEDPARDARAACARRPVPYRQRWTPTRTCRSNARCARGWA